MSFDEHLERRHINLISISQWGTCIANLLVAASSDEAVQCESCSTWSMKNQGSIPETEI